MAAPQRILVTGGAGFVGSRLVKKLQETIPGVDLLVVDDFRTGTFANLSEEGKRGWSYRGRVIAYPLHEVDIDGLIEDFEPDAVYHEASITDTTVEDEAAMIRDNVEPFEALLAVCLEREIPLVWVSSAATYGTQASGATAERRLFKPDDAGRPANVYGFSKWVMENAQRRLMPHFPDGHVVGLRYFNVFGPGEANKGHMASMIRQLALQMLDGKRPRIFAPGTQARDHVHVSDVVDATIAAARPGARSGIYNVGTGEATSFNQVVDALNEALGTDLQPEYFDNPFRFYQDHTQADLAETREALKWKPRFSTAEGIKHYAGILKSEREENRG
ncbi:NAD-dependent epimerase/dehydratase family protein [Phycisphaera mikurensis]|uniref:ADP-L-glycero-D-manno-heptose-6-epimerase n=1 Tax=Phycisphaera mikurensis (strain NBRC 102666 / KCTC 22515 / FYK2301M01) TaxID=1142394 RepID=I0IHI9_PHYMF|nr:NAD-dependent epimerase/dehydratase family protein [Phycisphaera mikurensis]MBB6440971.1 ADP-L-glycero-D-manno-heptose 6-epimerase [Phycisphaera mikurensis]BAM04727.1 ADP-L-glycero-D-manno-heptose-6-epimerase [Phycisphaera mikurensis NBRC 102666]